VANLTTFTNDSHLVKALGRPTDTRSAVRSQSNSTSALKRVDARRRSQRLVHPVDLTEKKGGLPIADDDRRDNDVQTIETARRQETRESVRAPFNKHAAPSEFGEAAKDGRWSDVPLERRQGEGLDARTVDMFAAQGRHDEAANSIGRQQARVRRKTPARIDHDARRAWSADAADRQLRVVRLGGGHTDYHGVDQRTKAMQMREARRPIDAIRPSGRRRDAAVERLPDLADHNEVVDSSLAQRPE